MAYTPQPITVARYEAKTLRVTMSPATVVTGWTFSLNVRSAGVVVTGFPLTSFTIEDATNGIFKVTITSALTSTLAAGGIYDYDIWRTNSGSEAQLVVGQISVSPEQWQ